MARADLNDRDDVARFLAGDVRAFEVILERHQTALLRFASHHLGSRSAAEDVVQEAFTRLLREMQSLNGTETLAAWLFRVCRNLCADARRREMRMQQRHLRVAVPELETPGPALIEVEEEHGRVRALLDRLPENEREILVLKVLEGKSYREITAELGVTLHEVFTTAHRALKKLADGMKSAGLA